MRGTELTQAQLDAAENFILGRLKRPCKPVTGDQVVQEWDDLVRIVAWYGAIRYRSGEMRLGTLEKPNPVVGKDGL